MKKQIMVCDDDEAILEVVKVILTEEGYQVTDFNNCENIVAKVKNSKPNLIILDIWMPKIDAREAVKLLREDDFCKSIPVVLISALNDAESISEELKVQGFLKKPFNINDLSSVVAKLVGK